MSSSSQSRRIDILTKELKNLEILLELHTTAGLSTSYAYVPADSLFAPSPDVDDTALTDGIQRFIGILEGTKPLTKKMTVPEVLDVSKATTNSEILDEKLKVMATLWEQAVSVIETMAKFNKHYPGSWPLESQNEEMSNMTNPPPGITVLSTIPMGRGTVASLASHWRGMAERIICDHYSRDPGLPPVELNADFLGRSIPDLEGARNFTSPSTHPWLLCPSRSMTVALGMFQQLILDERPSSLRDSHLQTLREHLVKKHRGPEPKLRILHMTESMLSVMRALEKNGLDADCAEARSSLKNALISAGSVVAESGIEGSNALTRLSVLKSFTQGMRTLAEEYQHKPNHRITCTGACNLIKPILPTEEPS